MLNAENIFYYLFSMYLKWQMQMFFQTVKSYSWVLLSQRNGGIVTEKRKEQIKYLYAPFNPMRAGDA